ncbi:MAG: ParA family protein [Alphaproteobacteria bacterium]|nr:ParA family protein [Alphaproteobacteria bacterium]
MRIIAVTNQKGGSAKTTTTVNLAAALAEAKKRVLVIDLDPQGNTTSWLGITAPDRGALELLTDIDPPESLIRESTTVGVDCIPSTRGLNGAERQLAREMSAETTLKRRIAGMAGARWDYLLIDTPPTLGLLTLNALAASDELIVPVEAHVLALAGVAQLFDTVRTVNERLNPSLTIAGIVACRVDTRTRHASDVVDSLRHTFTSQVFKTEVRENIRLAEAPSFHQPITTYDPRSTGALDYRALAREVLAQEAGRHV